MNYSPFNIRVGKRIKKARKEIKLSQSGLAHLMGKARGWVSQVETGWHGLTFKDALELASALSVPVEELAP